MLKSVVKCTAQQELKVYLFLQLPEKLFILELHTPLFTWVFTKRALNMRMISSFPQKYAVKFSVFPDHWREFSQILVGLLDFFFFIISLSTFGTLDIYSAPEESSLLLNPDQTGENTGVGSSGQLQVKSKHAGDCTFWPNSNRVLVVILIPLRNMTSGTSKKLQLLCIIYSSYLFVFI